MSKMLDEIREQPATLERTLARQVAGIERLKKSLQRRRPRLILLAARGTSDNAALFARYLLEITTGIPVSLAAPSIFTLYGAKVDFRECLAIAISQSGESTDTNIVLERARAAGALTVGVTNEHRSSLARLAEYVFLVRARRERSVAATKTYSGQLLAAYLLAYALGAAINLDDLRRLPEWTDSALRLEPQVRALAGRYRFMQHAVVVGRGLNYANAFELALKLMETCYVVAERFSSADLLHGPIAMVEPSFPVFLFTPGGVTWLTMREMARKLHSMKAETLLITDKGNRDTGEISSASVVIPARISRRLSRGLPVELYTPIPYIVPGQLLAACLAEEKGLDPDKPRSLTKVTRTL